jgi:hypothetical protein
MRWSAVLAVLVVAGCASTQPVPVGPPPTGADELVFRVADLPGLMAPAQSFGLPRLSLYGDGRLVVGDPTPAALPDPISRQLTEAGVRSVVQAAADAGLTDHTDFGTPQLPDAGVTVFTVVADERVDTKVVAPSQDDDVTAPQREARQLLRSFVDNLADLDSWLGDDIDEEARPYRYTRLAVLALPQQAPLGSPQRPWPLDDLATAGRPHGTGRCLVVAEAELAPVRAAATDVAPDTWWRSGDQVFQVALRPLLPDERTCEDLPE